MKVLWLVNIIMPDFAKYLAMDLPNLGGWLQGQLDALKNTDIKLIICTVSDKVIQVKNGEINGVTYYAFPQCANYRAEFKKLLQSTAPEVVHIFGTEKPQSLAMAQAANYKNCLVTIQGLVSEYMHHYFDGIPEKYRKISFFKSSCETAFKKGKIYPSIIAADYKIFCENAQNEVELLKNNQYFSGRTHWDKNSVLKNNPSANYFVLNENLRAEFYTNDSWSTKNMTKHRVFVSQANYPIKGFHMLLQSAAQIKKTYPNLQIAVGGYAPIQVKNPFFACAVNYFFEYQGFVKRLIKKYNLQENISFLGQLNAEQMKEQYLKANVFVSPSAIENSPNSVGEAMILGTPVIASNVGGVSSLLTNEVEGILYNFYDTKKLADSIIRIFEDTEFAKKLSKNAMARAVKTHDKNANANALIQIYNNISKI